jgi:hypothetical protein
MDTKFIKKNDKKGLLVAEIATIIRLKVAENETKRGG